MLLSGSDIIVECLLEQGADTVFGYPGGAVLNIYDSLYKYSDRIRHIITSHEQGACHAADGFARATGKTGVVIATSGPGATNLTTGLATANMDSIPLVAITGNVSTDLLGLDSFQEVDITGVTMPITKHNFIVKDISELADTIRLAFEIAGSGRKGPVLVDIPKDITAAMCEYNKSKGFEPREADSADNIKELETAAALIEKSERPYIYAGGGVVSAEAVDELKKFAELCDAPVSCSLMGQGAYDQTNRRYIGMLGMHGTVKAAAALNSCDLFIGVGTRFSDRVIGDPNVFGRNAKFIHIDIDPAEFNKNVAVGCAVPCDVKSALAALCGRISQKKNSWTDEIIAKDFGEPVQTGTEEFPVTPQAVIEKLDELTDGNAVIATEVGQNQMWAAQYYKFKEQRSFISSGGLGTMGFGLGAAIGAKVGRPDKTVVNIAGDGSFAMNLNELITASAHNIPIIEMVINNSVLGMVRQWQRLFYNKHFSQTTLDARHIDYVKLGESFGIQTFVIAKNEDIEPTLKKALEISKTAPVMIEVRIDRDINVLPMIPAGKPVVDPITEIDLEA